MSSIFHAPLTEKPYSQMRTIKKSLFWRLFSDQYSFFGANLLFVLVEKSGGRTETNIHVKSLAFLSYSSPNQRTREKWKSHCYSPKTFILQYGLQITTKKNPKLICSVRRLTSDIKLISWNVTAALYLKAVVPWRRRKAALVSDRGSGHCKVDVNRQSGKKSKSRRIKHLHSKGHKKFWGKEEKKKDVLSYRIKSNLNAYE